MNNITQFLNQLSFYPKLHEIADASDHAQEVAFKYALSIDKNCQVNVEEGQVYVKWDIEDEDGEHSMNTQAEFDEAFSEKILQMGYFE
jgi:hypothetical protein